MSPGPSRDESNHPMTQPGHSQCAADAPNEVGRQAQMSQPTWQRGEVDRDQAQWLVPDTRDDIVVSRVQE